MVRLLATLILAASAAGCSPPGEDPDRGSTMTLLVTEGDRYTVRRGLVTPLLFLPLVIDEGPRGIPRLAESWEHSPDYRTWTYHLRDDLRWHDGVPVTAHDVAFNIELFKHPDVHWAPWIWGSVDSVSVTDDHTITLYRNKPSLRLWRFTHMYPKHLLADLDPAGFYEWDFWIRPVGNGPYRFVRHVPQTTFEFEANPDFYAGEVIELTSGAADVAFALLSAEVLKLDADPEFIVYRSYDWLDMPAIFWNQAHPLFADAVVRRALSHAIDRREIARVLHYPDEMPLMGGFSDPHWGDEPYRLRGWDQGPTYDPELAARLLEQAGWIDRDRDGIREKDDWEARFTLSVQTGAWIPGLEPGILIQDQLRNVGIAVEIRGLEYAAWRDAWKAGAFEGMVGWLENDPPSILGSWFDPSPFGYYNAEVVRLFRSLETTFDTEARYAVYRRINQIMRRDMPVTFLFPQTDAFAAHRRIRGLRSGAMWNALAQAEELWIEETQR